MTSEPDDPESDFNTEDTLIGLVLAGRFRVVERIGSGGMGRVYAAKQMGLNRMVALKVLQPEHETDPEIVSRFELEMKATTAIDHPNTVHVYDFGQTERGDFYLAMEMIEGRDLEEVLVDERRMEPVRVAHIGRQIALALGAAHKEGVIHRDLKPQNVMISDRYDKRGHVKVLDFGLARFLEANEAAPLTAYGTRVGTPLYMAPEYIVGKPIDHRADLYSLGIILYQMITGKPPFLSGSPYAVLEKHVKETPAKPSTASPDGCPEWLEVLVLSLIEKDPDKRPQNAETVAKTLEKGEIYEEASTNAEFFEELSGTHPLPITHPGVDVETPAEPKPDYRPAVVAGLVGAATVLGALALVGIGILIALFAFG